MNSDFLPRNIFLYKFSDFNEYQELWCRFMLRKRKLSVTDISVYKSLPCILSRCPPLQKFENRCIEIFYPPVKHKVFSTSVLFHILLTDQILGKQEQQISYGKIFSSASVLCGIVISMKSQSLTLYYTTGKNPITQK